MRTSEPRATVAASIVFHGVRGHDDVRTVRSERGGVLRRKCIDPLETLSDTDASVDVAISSGNTLVADDRSIDPENVGKDIAEWVTEVHSND